MKIVKSHVHKLLMLVIVASFSATAQYGSRGVAKSAKLPPVEAPLCGYIDPETSELVITHCAGDVDNQLCAYRDSNGKLVVRHCDVPADPTE